MRGQQVVVQKLEEVLKLLDEAIAATTCPVCRQQLEALKAAASELKEQVELAVKYAEKVASARELNEIVKRYGRRSSGPEDIASAIVRELYGDLDERIRRLEERLAGARQRGRQRKGLIDAAIDVMLAPVTALVDAL